jgi:hypothetical protein
MSGKRQRYELFGRRGFSPSRGGNVSGGAQTGGTAPGRTWSGKPVGSPRRRGRLIVGVLALSLIVMFAAWETVFYSGPIASVGRPGACIECPDYPGLCYPNCNPGSGGGGCDPTVVPTTFSDVDVTAESTNVTISWDNSPAAGNDTFYWGNTTDYGDYQSTAGDGSYTQFINYLEPGTTYYFKVVPSVPASTCDYTYTGGVYEGDWVGQSDSMSSIQGVVTNPGGTSHAGAGIFVSVGCLSGTDVDGGYWNPYTVTGSNGAYSVNTELDPPVYTQPACSGGFVVKLLNSPQYCLDNNWCREYGLDGAYSSTWQGYWNETVVTWASQYVNFELPSNYLTTYTPGIVDFSNAPAESGYTTLEVNQGTGYGNSYTYSWSAGASVAGIGGGKSGSTTAGTSITTQTGWEATTDNLCVAYKYDVSGTVLYNAIYSSWEFNQTLFDAQDGEFCNQVGVSVPANWFDNETNSAEDIHLMAGAANSHWTNGLQNVPLWKGDSIPYDLTISSSTSSTTGLNLDFGISAALEGVIPLNFQASEGWSQTVQSTTSTELTYDIVGPSQTAVSCYNVFGEGGSLSANSADMIAIYYWTGSDVDNTPVCS